MGDDRITFDELLTEEHNVLRRALKLLRIVTHGVECGGTADPHDVNALLVFFHLFGDVLHQTKEESILFPALQSSAEHSVLPKLEALVLEHNQQRVLIKKAQFSLFTDQHDQFIASAHKLINLLSEHIDEEEKVLFPLAASALSLVMANEVTTRILEADAQFGVYQRQLLIDTLQRLEVRYLQNAA